MSPLVTCRRWVSPAGLPLTYCLLQGHRDAGPERQRPGGNNHYRSFCAPPLAHTSSPSCSWLWPSCGKSLVPLISQLVGFFLLVGSEVVPSQVAVAYSSCTHRASPVRRADDFQQVFPRRAPPTPAPRVAPRQPRTHSSPPADWLLGRGQWPISGRLTKNSPEKAEEDELSARMEVWRAVKVGWCYISREMSHDQENV